MVRFLAALMLGGVTIAQLSFTDAEAQQIADNKFIANADGTPGNLPTLPAAPRGKSTVIGGAIHDVDPVRDQLTLNVSGAKQRMIVNQKDSNESVFHTRGSLSNGDGRGKLA